MLSLNVTYYLYFNSLSLCIPIWSFHFPDIYIYLVQEFSTTEEELVCSIHFATPAGETHLFVKGVEFDPQLAALNYFLWYLHIYDKFF